MIESVNPSAFMVDSNVSWPPVPLTPSQGRWRARATPQNLLFLLVSVALAGMAVEAYFIYRLYQPEPGTSASTSKIVAGLSQPVKRSSPNMPSKPVAHLTDGQDVVHGSKIMSWSTIADPLCHDMNYKDGFLLIQKEGFYYVYSKIYVLFNNVFYHSVELNTKRYLGESITLLMSTKRSTKAHKLYSNSYLGGVFRLQKDDAIFVKVSNTSQIVHSKSFENVFGAFMV
ncbi:tumor necrosis factor ligand superfamily member 14 [Brachionichthys hirsutus]|uniref:tumor necrosis factor ligand superfamily member 14 n=1 Tax=Brachionichthys hirsutus TaxID=412623 RepID=UPI003604CAC6